MDKIEVLFSKVKEFVLCLASKTCLSSFYIGKAEDVEKRQLKHHGEGYFCSLEIAKSSSPNLIDNTERYLIDKFKKEQMPIVFDNENNGGGGNPKADKLYISLRFNLNSMDEIEDVDEDNLVFESVEL